MPNKAAIDRTKAVNIFTKRLLHALTEGHTVEQEEIDVLNDMRVEAGMKPLNIAVPSQSKAEEKKAPAAPQQPYQQQRDYTEGKPPRGNRKPPKTDENTEFNPQAITINGQRFEGQLLPEGKLWTNRFYIKSESSGRLYTIAQNKSGRFWGCDCPGWISHRKCKHLTALGLPHYEKPFEVQLKSASTKTGSLIKFADDIYPEMAHILAAELIHSDAELSQMMEPMVPEIKGEAHIDGPEAEPSNDEFHANTHEESGVPVTDGDLVSPERQNVTAIKDAIEGKAEMEIGKPISQKQEEVDIATEARDEKAMHPEGATEVSAKPGTQIIINVGSKQAGRSAQIADRLMLLENDVWDKLGIESGGQIMDDPQLEQRYQAAMTEAIKASGIKSIPQSVIDYLTNDNYHQLVKLLTRKGKSASNEGGAWSISGVTPNHETADDVNKALKRMKAAEGIGGEDDSKITSGQGGGMFGGTDLEGPSFHVGFTFRGTEREASFSSLKEAQTFVKGASEKFGKVASGWVITGAADPAKRNLILETLRHGEKTTGEIEKILGGGKYTNLAYPILQELAKEGLLAHKKMRWSLKASVKKAYKVGKIAFSVETRVSEHNGITPEIVAKKLNEVFQELKRKNPKGFMDSFEQQLPSRMMDIAMALGLQVDYTPENDTYIFYDRLGEGTKDKAFEEFPQVSASAKSATIHVTSSQPLPRSGTPEAAELKIAIQTLKMPDPMQNVMGEPGREHALKTLERYGLRWDEKAYMSGGTGVKKAGDGMAKTEQELEKEAGEKEAGFNFFFPGQVVKEFYPEIQHEIVDYPNASNQPMSGAGSPEIVGDGGHELEGMLDEALDTNLVEMIQLPADIGEVEPLAMAAADYSSTSPAGGMGIGRDGKPEVLEGAPLRKENDIRGPMFTDEFYGQYDGIPGAAMAVASKTAAEGDEPKQFAMFLKKVCGEIAATLVYAFKLTSRPLLDKVPGMGQVKLDIIEQGNSPIPLGSDVQGGRVKWLMENLNDGDVKAAINEAWAQAAVWNDSPNGGFVYEVFVRPETIDTDSLVMKYKFVCGTRE